MLMAAFVEQVWQPPTGILHVFTHWRSYDAQTTAYVYRLSYFRPSRTQISTESENLYYMNSANTFYSLLRQNSASIIETETKNQVLKMFENAYM